jgi:hypothetical protein
VPEISHVRIAVPEQGILNRILREGGSQLFPQWLYAEPGVEARILWWGVRGALTAPSPEDVGVSPGLMPRQVDDWTEAPRGLVLATVDAQRAAKSLDPILGDGWHATGRDDLLGADCWRLALGRSVLVLAEPLTEGYVAACLARFGEGPIAVALDGAPASGRAALTNPISDATATYVRIGARTAPTLIFLPPR